MHRPQRALLATNVAGTSGDLGRHVPFIVAYVVESVRAQGQKLNLRNTSLPNRAGFSLSCSEYST
jgi:hypothetical protein